MDASQQCKTNMVMLSIPVRSHCGSSAFVTNIRPEDEEVLSRGCRDLGLGKVSLVLKGVPDGSHRSRLWLWGKGL